MNKYIRAFESYVNESSNTDEIKKWMKIVWNELQFINPIKKTYTKNINYIMIKVSFSKTDKETRNILKEKLNELKELLIENGIMIHTFINYDEVEIYFKIMNIKIEPTRYIYHSSPVENRDSILKNGLIPKSSDESKEWAYTLYSYPKAIFATMVNLENGIINPWKNNGEIDIWRIDTNKLKNEWFVDLNYTGEKDNQHIMTFQPIPPKYLELVKKGIKK